MGYGSFGVGYIPKPEKLQIIDGTATLDSSGVIQVETSKAIVDLALVKFYAPCGSSEAAGIAFNGGETYDIMDTSNSSILGLSGYFVSGAAVAVLIDSNEEIAYIQGGSGQAGSLITVTFDGGFAGQKFTISGGGETYTGIIPNNNIVNQWVIPVDCTYTISAKTADGQTWSNTVQADEWFTWLQVTVNGYVVPIEEIPAQSGTLTYNGQAQSPQWSNYSPYQLIIGGTTSATDAGTYTATFTPRSGYEWEDGTTTAKNVQWSIGKAAGSLSITPESMTLTNSQPTGTIYVTRAGTGAISAQSSDPDAASVSVSGNVVTVTGHEEGDAIITISVAADNNHNAPTSKTCSVELDFLAVGTSWTYTANTTFAVPVTGSYQVELHGGGGGGGGGGSYSMGADGGYGGNGGGSGMQQTTQLTAGEQVQVTIGQGGAGSRSAGSSGGASSFGSITVQGGGGGGKGGNGDNYRPGAAGEAGTAQGNLASGKEGNKNNTSQIYGDGGSGGDGAWGYSEPPTAGTSGQNGACIITYLGEGS